MLRDMSMDPKPTIPEKKADKQLQIELKKRWLRSPWRVAPSLVAAYVVTGAFLWTIDTPDAWLRAIGPVLTVGTYLTMRPFIMRWWFRRTKRRLRGQL